MTTEAMTSALKNKMLAALLKGMSDSAMSDYAKLTQPPVPTPEVGGGRVGNELELWTELLRAHIHEQGHAAMMRHLEPSSDPDVEVNALPSICNEGVGVEIRGASCRTTFDFGVVPHDSIMVSVAGWMAETVSLATATEAGGIFTKLTPQIVAGLWIVPQFAEMFPGCDKDAEEVHRSAQKWLPPEFAKREDVPDEEVRPTVQAIGQKLEAAMGAALRFMESNAEQIIRTATLIAETHYRILMTSAFEVGQALDRAQGAALGLFTAEEIAARKAENAAARKAGGEAKKPHIWEGQA